MADGDSFLSQFTRVGPANPQPGPGGPGNPGMGAGGAPLAIPRTADQAIDPNVHGEEFLNFLKERDSPGYATQVKSYAEGKFPIPSGFALKAPYFQKLLRDITTYDPTFDATNYGARASQRRNYLGGGKQFQELQAVATVAGHLHDLMDKADKLDNFEGLGPLNAPVNALVKGYRDVSQDPRIADFEATRNAVVRELTKAYQGGHITDSAVAEWMKALNASQTPTQLKTVIGTLNQLLSSKRLAMEEGYRSTMGPNPILPEQFSTMNDRTRKLFEDVENWSMGAKKPSAAAKPAAPAPGKYVFDPKTGELVAQ